MYNLVLKEFSILKKVFVFGIIYIIFCAFAFQGITSDGGGIYTIAPFVVVYLCINLSNGYDDKSKADIVFNSLPIKREDVVISKYASALIFAGFGIICSALIGGLCFFTGIAGINRVISLDDIFTVLAGAGIFIALFYPLYFKFGIIRMKFVNILLILVFMFLPAFIKNYFVNYPNNFIVRYILSFYKNTSGSILNLLYIVVACIIILTSLLISINIYKNKEF